MRHLYCDVETYSSVPIGDCGVYRYCESPDFKILMLGYAYDDEPVSVIDLTREEMPSPLRQDIRHNPEVVKSGWNINFEITCFSQYFGEPLDPAEWSDTMILAAELGLPRSLKDVGAALGLPQDEVKDRRGKALIRYFSVPCAPTKANGGRTRNRPEDDPAKWQEYIEYNRQDVVAERAIRKKLSAYPLTPGEQAAWLLDQQINTRGVLCDRKLAEQAVKMSEEHTASLMQELRQITGLENPNSLIQLKGWLGVEGPLDKEAVSERLKTETDPAKRRVLEIRQEIGKSSIKKYQAMLNYMCKDDRCRGLFQFYGASRSGRFAGRGIQLQNLYRNDLPDLDTARNLVLEGDREGVEMLFGSVPDTLSQLIRTAFIPKKGCTFAVADFSAIEARVVAWLTGEKWRMDLFARGGDIYCQSASEMFHKKVVKHGENGELRQKGKIAELACIAEDSLVLTDRGLVPIQNVTTDTKLWDGEEWVTHEGVIYKGERDVISYEGLTATPDHEVYAEGETNPIRFDIAAANRASLIRSGDGRKAIRTPNDHQSRKKMGKELESLPCSDKVRHLRKRTLGIVRRFKKRSLSGMYDLCSPKACSRVANDQVTKRKKTVLKSTTPTIQKLRWAGNKVRVRWGTGGRIVLNPRIRRCAKQVLRNRPDRHERELRTRKYPVCIQAREFGEPTMHNPLSIRTKVLAVSKMDCRQKASGRKDTRRNYSGSKRLCSQPRISLETGTRTVSVYDIRNAGRHHRFTVSNILVHNCGYGGSVGAMINMGALKMGLKEEELPEIVEKWREASPHIVEYWYEIGDAVMRAVRYGDRVRMEHGIEIWRTGKLLHIQLPSGRCLRYFDPGITTNRFGNPSIDYQAYEAGRWSRAETYGPKILENVTQGIARDCLLVAMQRVAKRYPDIVMHVHDEMIVEVPTEEAEEALQFICREMGREIPWAPGLLLRGDGYLCDYYKKD